MAQTVWRGHLTFGLVSFPVRLFKAARPEKISLRRLYRPSAPVEREPEAEPAPQGKGRSQRAPEPGPEPEVFRTENRIVAPAAPPPSDVPEPDPDDTEEASDFTPPPSSIVKGYEYEKGRYVVLEDEELKSLVPETSKEMQVLEFVHLNEIDPVFFETSYYVRPDEAGERPYSLLYEAMREAGYVGLAQLAMHRREHVVVIRPGPKGLIAHTMFFADEIRSSEEFHADTSGINARELDLAKRLIDTMAVPFEPEKFRDTYRERLQQMIDAKLAGKRVARETAAAPRSAQVIDIFDALQKSLNAMKKPAAGAPASGKRRTRKAG